MFRFLILLLFTINSIYCLTNDALLQKANHLIESKNKSDHFRAYNDFKNLYLNSVMNGDKALRIHSLEGIVKSGNLICINVNKYESELNDLNSLSSQNQEMAGIKQASCSNQSKISISSLNILKLSQVEKNRLILSFENNLKSNDVNFFKLYDSKVKRYRYIFDVHATILTSSKTIIQKNIKKIKITQLNSNTLRLLIEDDEKINLEFKIDLKELIVNLNIQNEKEIALDNNEVSTSSLDAMQNIPNILKKIDKNKTIVIDPGHGGKDPGAIGYKKYKEKIIVFKIANYLKDILRNRGYKVYMTRNDDTFINLTSRTDLANEKKADLFVSIHANAVSKATSGTVQGIETYFLSPSRSDRATSVAATENSSDMTDMNTYGKQSFLNFLNHYKIIASNKLAIDLQRGMLGALNKHYKNVNDNGVKEGPFWILVGAQMPAVLIEIGFLSHPTEAQRLADDKYKKIMAIGMADGIERYFANNQ